MRLRKPKQNRVLQLPALRVQGFYTIDGTPVRRGQLTLMAGEPTSLEGLTYLPTAVVATLGKDGSFDVTLPVIPKVVMD